MPSHSAAVEISVVVPCLNEEVAVGAVVDRAWYGIELSGRRGEVIVVDNGSTDRSAEIAASHGATVVSQPNRGYGNAYLAGLAAARGRFIVMGDADETYDFATIPQFVDALDGGADMVIGSRLKGTIEDGAMPWSHRWIGNPLITGMINLMFHASVSDAYCGLRAVRREALSRLDLRSPGMEFALEMVFKAGRSRLSIAEIPIDYHRRRGESKLSSLSDGWRSVKFILVHSPSWFFLVPGACLVLPSLIGAVLLSTGPVDALGRTWEINSLYLCVALFLLGTQLAELGIVARTFGAVQLGDPDPLLERMYRRFRLEHALLGGALVLVAGLLVLAAVFTLWAVDGFNDIENGHQGVIGFALAGLGVQTIFSAFLVSIVGQPVASAPASVAGANAADEPAEEDIALLR